MKYTCPVCKKSLKGSPAEGAEKAEFFPFCSHRCKLIDLGAWLDARYKIVYEQGGQGSIEPAAPSEEPGGAGQPQ
jgi:endogenous inhibitor of DNA gyrase (YacG/DUF329 family)